MINNEMLNKEEGTVNTDKDLNLSIVNGRLLNNQCDISDSMSAAEFKEAAEKLLLYAKFKSSVDKAAAMCFGEPKKRKAPVKKAKLVPAVKSNMTEVTAEDENDMLTFEPNTGEAF